MSEPKTKIEPNKSHKKSKKPYFSTESRILIFRIGVGVCLIVAAAVVGYFAYELLYQQETNLLNEQYGSLVSRLQQSETQFINAQVQTIKSFNHYIQSNCPNSTQWPYCTVPLDTFNDMSYDLQPLTSYRSIVMYPVVSAVESISFEKFALKYYESQGHPNLGTSSNGVRGIFVESNGVPHHNVNVTPANSKYQILVPSFIIGPLNQNEGSALFNIYSDADRAACVNYLIECTSSTGNSEKCYAITDVVKLVQDVDYRPAAVIYSSLTALDEPNRTIGLTSSIFNWDTTLSNSIPDYVVGFVVVLDSGDHKETFQINHGKATYQGEGDLHDSKYSSYARTFIATPFSHTVRYTLTVYPSDEFINQYHTDLPWIACLIVVLISIFTAFVFLLYDFFVKRQATEKEAIIATRRQFVNFISHEIRTPLNTISLGMKLLLSEMTSTIDSYREKNEETTSTVMIGDASTTTESVTTIEPTTTTTDVVKSNNEDIIKKLEDYLNVIKDVEDSSYMAITILNDILNYDKLMQGKLNLEVEVFNIWELVRSSSRAFIIQARQKKVVYDFKFQVDIAREELAPKQVDVVQVNEPSLEYGVLPCIEEEKNYRDGDKENVATTIKAVPSIESVVSNDAKPDNTVGNNHNDTLSKKIRRLSMKLMDSTNFSTSQSDRAMSVSINNSIEKGFSFEKYLEMKNLVVIGDKIKVSQVLRNMISNALKFTSTEGLVTVSAEWNENDKQFNDLCVYRKITSDENGGDEENGEHQELILGPSSTSTNSSLSRNKTKLSTLNILKVNSRKSSEGSLSKNRIEKVEDYKYAGSVTVKVTDSGAGLSKENLSQLFQEGVQFNANKLQGGGGSGLGLWISKGIVDMHHGLLYATSPGVGLGCSFVVSIIFYTSYIISISITFNLIIKYLHIYIVDTTCVY